MIISPYYTERHESVGQANEKYSSIGIYTLIYISRETFTSRHYEGESFPHDSTIILVKIHLYYINLLRLQCLV